MSKAIESLTIEEQTTFRAEIGAASGEQGGKADTALQPFAQSLTISQARQVLANLGAESSPYNVVKYGADATGAADSTSAIHDAIAAAQAVGSPVYFPAGVFKCNLIIAGRLQVIGAGEGDVGDWDATSEYQPKTKLIPNSNASPVIKVTALKGIQIEHLDIWGNGAGTSVSGLLIDDPNQGFSGNGLVVKCVIIRRFTTNFHSIGGCNVLFEMGGLFEGITNVRIEDDGFAHSYIFKLLTVGGVPATGNGRCFHLSGGSFVTIDCCEQGNCYDYLYTTGGGQNITIIGSNWETFSGTVLMTIDGVCGLNMIGPRLAIGPGKVLVKTTSYPDIVISGMQVPGGGKIQHVTATIPNIRVIGTGGGGGGIVVEQWNADFTVMAGSSPILRARSAGALTTEQAITGGAGVYTVVYNSDSGNSINNPYNYSTGVFTAGRTGWYNVTASMRLSTVNGYAAIMFYVNGAERSVPVLLLAGSAGTTLCGADSVWLNAGDALTIRLATGGNCNIQVASNNSTKFSIVESEP